MRHRRLTGMGDRAERNAVGEVSSGSFFLGHPPLVPCLLLRSFHRSSCSTLLATCDREVARDSGGPRDGLINFSPILFILACLSWARWSEYRPISPPG